MITDFLNTGIPGWILLVVAAGFLIYGLAAIWTSVAAGRLLWQNLFRSNRVELPRLGRPLPVLPAGTTSQESTALVLSRAPIPINPDQPAPRDFTNIIYPVAGRNGLHFAPDRCTGCGLCVYSCPTGAITTQAQDEGHLRRFDLKTCVYCGLCESACPTSAIRLTFNPQPAQPERAGLMVEGHVKSEPCPKCKQKVPRPDLLAERIYELHSHDEEPDEDEINLRRKVINPQGVCLECQKRVLEAEELICG